VPPVGPHQVPLPRPRTRPLPAGGDLPMSRPAGHAGAPGREERGRTVHTIERLSPEEIGRHGEELGGMLADVVAGGASVGFRAPFDCQAAAGWWRERQPEVSDGRLTVWVARGPSGIAGTVCLSLSPKPNAAHRGEIVKLMVHPGARGRGLGRA